MRACVRACVGTVQCMLVCAYSVWHLKKGLYGTKQAGKIWYETFTTNLEQDASLIRHSSDPCLFTKVDKNREIITIASIYVDDAIVGGPIVVIEQVKKDIAKQFAIKDLGIAKHVVGIQVEQTSEGTLLTQTSYIDEILALTGQECSNICYVPMFMYDVSYTMAKEDGDNKDKPEFALLPTAEHHKYREYVGKLMYLMVCTRPDIAFAVNYLARLCAAPERRHMASVMNLARYLKGTRELGLFYPRLQKGDKPSLNLCGYVDASFADCAMCVLVTVCLHVCALACGE